MSPGRDVFHAVSDANRRAMLDLLREQERPVQEIVEHFQLTFQGVSQHLAVLARVGLVHRRKDGRYRYYRTNSAALKEIYDWVSPYRSFWEVQLKRLGDYLDERA